MTIRNYTSTMSPAKIAGKMQEMLAGAGAEAVSLDYEDGDPVAITFRMAVHGRPMHFRLEPDPRAVLAAMKDDNDVPGNKCNEKQASRTAWKNKHDWLSVQLAEVAAGQARIEQLLLGYAVTNDGQTLYERLRDGRGLLEGQKRLEAGRE